MGKFYNFLEKYNEKIFLILEKILSFKFAVKWLLLPFFITAILDYLGMIPKYYVLYVYLGLLALLAFYFFIFLIYSILIAMFPKYLFDQDLDEGDIILLIIFSIVLIAVIKVFQPASITSQFIDYFISVASGMGTFLVAIIAVLGVRQSKNQLKELEKQRKTQYVPKLVPTNNYFDLECTPYEKSTVSEIFWKERNGKYGREAKELNTFEKIPYFKLYNIGKGFSKNIKLTFEVDYKSIIDSIDEKNGLEKEYEPRENGHGYLRIYPPAKKFITGSSVYKEIVFEYEISSPSVNKPLIVPLPEDILRIYSSVIITNSIIKYPIGKPWYTLSIQYEDIDNESHTENYIMTIVSSGVYYDEEKKILGGLCIEFDEPKKYYEKIDEKYKNILF